MRSPIFRPTRSLAFAGCMLMSVVLFPGVAGATPETDMEARNAQIVTEAFDRWAAGGTTFFNDIVASNVSWTIKGSGPSAGTFKGRDVFIEQAVRPFVSRLSTPIRPVSKQVWADGDHVVIHWDGAGVARDGKPYTNSYAWIFRMHNGKAVDVTAFLDLAPYDDVLRRIPGPVSE